MIDQFNNTLVNLTTTNETASNNKSLDHMREWMFSENNLYHRISTVVFPIFIILSNLLLIVGILKTRNRTVPLSKLKKLFIALSMYDLLLALNTGAYYAIRPFVSSHRALSQVMLSISNMLQANGLITFVIISGTRYYSIKNPLRPISEQKLRRISGWSMSIAACVSFFLNPWSSDLYDMNYKAITGGFIFNGVTLFFIFINFSSYWFLKHESKHVLQSPGMESVTITSNKKKMKAVETLILITIPYIVCYIPYGSFMVYIGIKSEIDKGALSKDFIAKWLIPLHFLTLLNSGINSVIYIQRRADVKGYYKKLLRMRIRNKNDEREGTSQSY